MSIFGGTRSKRWFLAAAVVSVAGAAWGVTLPSNLTITPPLNLPAGYIPDDVVSFVYDASDLTLVSHFTDASRGLTRNVDIEIYRGGDWGYVMLNNAGVLPDGTTGPTIGNPQNTVIKNNTSRPIDFATILMVWNIEEIGADTDPTTECRYQLAPTRSFDPSDTTYQPQGPYDIVENYWGGPYDGLGVEMGFVTGDPFTDAVFQNGYSPAISDSEGETPFRAYDLTPIGILGPGESRTIVTMQDSNVEDALGSWDSFGNLRVHGGFFHVENEAVLLDRLIAIVDQLIQSGLLTTSGNGVNPLGKLNDAKTALARGNRNKARGLMTAFQGQLNNCLVNTSQQPVDKQFLSDAADDIIANL